MKLFLLTLFFSSAPFLAQAAENEFIVGTTSGYAPYVSLDGQGRYEGFDIEVAELLAKKLNKKLIIKDLGSMPSLMLALKQKKIDALIWAVSITQEREKKMEMIYYQGDKTTEMPFLFWEEVPKEITSIEALENQIVAVEAGSYQEGVLKNNPRIQLQYKDGIAEAILELKYGKVAAAPVDSSLLPRILEQYPNIKVAYLPLPPSECSLGNGICLNKAEAALAAEVRQAVEELMADGTIAQLEKKWKLGEG